jgi:hypothetical protein
VRRLRILFAYPTAHRRLVVRGLLLTAGVRSALWTLPPRAVLRFVRRTVERDLNRWHDGQPRFSPERIAWAIRLPARRVPRASCLTQALAAQMLLARYGHRSRLRIGVGRDTAGQFAAHAWVEVNGQLVIGGEIAHNYVPLPDIEGLISDGGDAVPAALLKA